MSDTFLTLMFHWSTLFGAGYFMFVILTSMWLLFLAVRQTQHARPLSYLPKHSGPLTPTTLLIPAHNEELTIVAALESHLQQQGPQVRIVVVCDGCTDATLARLIETFSLVHSHVEKMTKLPSAPVRGVYKDASGRLLVIDKHQGGKADALNCGLNYVGTSTFCVVDADSHLMPGALAELSLAFLDPQVIAAGGAVRLEAHTVQNSIYSPEAPRIAGPYRWLSGTYWLQLLVRLQWIEYVRSCVWMRMGWARWDSLLIISGAFGLFDTQKVLDIKGYCTTTVGEDMELVLRLHKTYGHLGGKITYRSAAVCFTQGPSTFKELGTQRKRWHRGLLESMRLHPNVFSKTLRMKNVLSFLGFLFLEVLSPLIEAFGWLFIALLCLFGIFHPIGLVYYLLASSLCYGLISCSTLVLDEHYYPEHHHWRGHSLRVFLLMFIETVLLRQIHMYWRVSSSVAWILGRSSVWGTISRQRLRTSSQGSL